MQDIRVRSGVIAEPVVVVDADVAMLDELRGTFLATSGAAAIATKEVMR